MNYIKQDIEDKILAISKKYCRLDRLLQQRAISMATSKIISQ